MNKIKKIVALFFVVVFSFSLCMSAFALDIKETKLELNGKSAILMDATTGTVLYESNADERLSPASVTKIMTLLLVFEAIQGGSLKWDDILVVSENAASMGGSQVFLEPGEKMCVEDLIKSVIVASANDAAVTLAEHVAGSEESFIEAMNKSASELGMENTKFENQPVKGEIELNKIGEKFVVDNGTYDYELIDLSNVKFGLYDIEGNLSSINLVFMLYDSPRFAEKLK